MVGSVDFNRDVSQGGTYSLGKYCSLEYLSVKIQTLTREILISWREHLLTSKKVLRELLFRSK